MDDLTTLKGIGKATEKKLRAAGIDSFAKLAASTPDQLNAAQVAGGPTDWAAMIAEAARQVPAVQARQLTDAELADLVVAWDAARTEMRNAGDAVAQLQVQLEGLAPDADRTALDADLELARARVVAAEAAITALTPLPEGVTLPQATTKQNTEGTSAAVSTSPATPAAAAAEVVLAAGSELAATNTQRSEVGHEGGAGNSAGPAAELAKLDALFLEELDRLCAQFDVERGDVLAAARRSLVEGEARKAASAEPRKPIDGDKLASVIEEEIEGVLASVRREAETDPAGALAHLDQQSHEARQMAAAATSIVTALAEERTRLARSVECWPLELVKYGGEDRPIGKSLMVEPEVFAQLFAAGAVSDQPPDAVTHPAAE